MLLFAVARYMMLVVLLFLAFARCIMYLSVLFVLRLLDAYFPCLFGIVAGWHVCNL